MYKNVKKGFNKVSRSSKNQKYKKITPEKINLDLMLLYFFSIFLYFYRYYIYFSHFTYCIYH